MCHPLDASPHHLPDARCSSKQLAMVASLFSPHRLTKDDRAASLQELLQQLVGGNSGVLVSAGQNMIGDSCFYQLDEKFVNNLVSLGHHVVPVALQYKELQERPAAAVPP